MGKASEELDFSIFMTYSEDGRKHFLRNFVPSIKPNTMNTSDLTLNFFFFWGRVTKFRTNANQQFILNYCSVYFILHVSRQGPKDSGQNGRQHPPNFTCSFCISGSHKGNYDGYGLLVCNNLQCGTSLPTFRGMYCFHFQDQRLSLIINRKETGGVLVAYFVLVPCVASL
jgi:hypothetical protein